MKARIKGSLSNQAQAVFNDEINRQAVEKSREWYANVDAVILWTLHREFGFGKKRLKRFYNAIVDNNKMLINYYSDNDTNFICTENLKRETGVDVSEWSTKIRNGERI